MSEIKVTKTLPEHSRKRVVQSNKHKRTISKQNRYSAKSLPKYPTCSHKEGTIKCRTLSMMDIKRFHELFYNNKDKVARDTLIYKCCYALKPKRSRLAINARGEAHYRTNVGMARSVCKKGKRILSIAPNKLVPGRTVNNETKKSIDNLLIKHFGPDWKSLQNLKFYKDAMENQNVQDSPSSSTMTEEFTCDQNPEDDTRFV
ncbi:hypothetical protein JTB14_025068 [Gonioctena quinquepunctata]|nr:hypothetical protein JTB14_025068 [Gonioctena quinquepunctata]